MGWLLSYWFDDGTHVHGHENASSCAYSCAQSHVHVHKAHDHANETWHGEVAIEDTWQGQQRSLKASAAIAITHVYMQSTSYRHASWLIYRYALDALSFWFYRYASHATYVLRQVLQWTAVANMSEVVLSGSRTDGQGSEVSEWFED